MKWRADAITARVVPNNEKNRGKIEHGKIGFLLCGTRKKNETP